MLRAQVFEQMVTESVQLQYAEQTGLRLDDAELERTLGRIAESNKLSRRLSVSASSAKAPT